MDAAAIIAMSGVSFGILIGQHRALSFQDCPADVVFRGN